VACPPQDNVSDEAGECQAKERRKKKVSKLFLTTDESRSILPGASVLHGGLLHRHPARGVTE
jgi:hypothetical protein